jgi:3-isopropylmalate dehydratase small subunit
MNEDKKLEEDFEKTRTQIHENVQKAMELILESSKLASRTGDTINSIDPSLSVELRNLLDDIGVIPEYEDSWSSSQQCW